MAKLSFARRIAQIFSSRKTVDEEFFEELCDALVEGDVGAKIAMEMTDSLESLCKKNRASSHEEILGALESMIRGCVHAADLSHERDKTNVWMALGVNGVGKTTTIAKIAKRLKDSGEPNVVLAAADTFRAAAIEQLQTHGERVGARVVSHQHGSDPAAVVFDAVSAVRAAGGGVALVDTAGRLHNKENLARELSKIDRVCAEKADEGCCKKFLVIDATTGQNALRQAEVFGETVKIDAIVLTKCDSTAKGGSIVSIGKELGLPVAFVCDGEKYDDIEPFDASAFARNFVGR